jgi:hypothetical protein
MRDANASGHHHAVSMDGAPTPAAPAAIAGPTLERSDLAAVVQGQSRAAAGPAVVLLLLLLLLPP